MVVSGGGWWLVVVSSHFRLKSNLGYVRLSCGWVGVLTMVDKGLEDSGATVTLDYTWESNLT